MVKLRPQYETASMTKDQFFSAYQFFAQQHDQHILLESGRTGQLCIAAVDPLVTLQTNKKNQLHLSWRDGKSEMREGEPLQLISDLLSTFSIERDERLPAFQGGVMGFISYDYARHFEELPTMAIDDLQTPDLFFYLFDEWAVLDIETSTVYFMTLPEHGKDPAHMKEKWLQVGNDTSCVQLQQASALVQLEQPSAVSVTKEQFVEMVREVQQSISAGMVEQVNLSVRQAAPLRTTPLQFYRALRKLNPSPYMAFMGAPHFAVASGSPELLLRKRGRIIETRPIGGTRPRGKNESEDATLEQELRTNQKELQEHRMLVEVELDDFQRVCEQHSVEVNESMIIEKYSHVMHIVSNIRGTVQSQVTLTDLIRAIFPGGSISGSPKQKTLTMIEQLEPTRRGLYTGSIGWIDFWHDLELNIAIRTAYMKDETVFIQAGAGLVADSIPEAEYEESIQKAQALWRAKELAESE